MLRILKEFFKKNEKKYISVWDAKRVLKDFLYLANENGHLADLTSWSEETPYRIRQRRFLAVMKAYGRNKESFYPSSQKSPFRHLISNTRSNEKMNEFRKLIKLHLPSDVSHDEMIASQDLFVKEGDILTAFEKLFEYRKKILSLEQQWSGVLECSKSLRLIIKVTDSLYQINIRHVSDLMDRMLILLMGDDFDKSFKEKDLFQYGYPNITDEDLKQMEDEDILSC